MLLYAEGCPRHGAGKERRVAPAPVSTGLVRGPTPARPSRCREGWECEGNFSEEVTRAGLERWAKVHLKRRRRSTFQAERRAGPEQSRGRPTCSENVPSLWVWSSDWTWRRTTEGDTTGGYNGQAGQNFGTSGTNRGLQAGHATTTWGF